MLLDRYLLRQILASFAIVAGVLVSIFLAYSLTRFLNDAAGGLLTVREAAELTLLKAIIALEVLLPLAFYFGLIVGCGGLNTHGELIAMRAAGRRRIRNHRPLILFGALLATLIAVFSLSIRPWAYSEIYALKARAQAASEIDRIKPEQFYLYEDGNRAVYIAGRKRNNDELEGVFIRTRNNDQIEIITAPRGRLEAFAVADRHHLYLSEASVYKIGENERDFYGQFESMRLSIRASDTIEQEIRTKSLDTPGLLQSDDAHHQAELQWRFSTPVSALLLVATALTLIDYRPRRGRYARLPVAIAIYAVYYNLLGVARTWVEQQTASSIAWVPMMFAVGLLLYQLQQQRRVSV